MWNLDQILAQAQRVQRRARPSSRRTTSGAASHGEQRILAQQYRVAASSGGPLPSFRESEFRNYSQNGEDGILLLLATVLDLQQRRIVEIGSADGIECNSANLILHHGWDALLIDGGATAIERGSRFYSAQPETFRVGSKLVHSWVTKDNAKALLAEHGYDRGVDLLSIDLDGVDLWVLQAIEPTANVLIVEFNNRLPAEVAVSVPYREEFYATGDRARGEGYFGASLQAFVTVLRPLGYRLIGANSISTNAFFALEGVGNDLFPEVPAASCQAALWARTMSAKWWPILKQRDWVEITPGVSSSAARGPA